MVKILIPSYMIGENDKVDTNEHGYAVVNVKSGKTIDETLINLKSQLPNALKNVVNGSEIKKNVIIAYNEQLMNYENITKIITSDNDEIEVLTQFAGG